jgi:hypothetical protein
VLQAMTLSACFYDFSTGGCLKFYAFKEFLFEVD